MQQLEVTVRCDFSGDGHRHCIAASDSPHVLKYGPAVANGSGDLQRPEVYLHTDMLATEYR